MALQIHTVDVPINGGLDTKGSPNILSPPVLTIADNVVYQTTGALRKRYGFNSLTTALSGGNSISVTTGKAIQNVNGELTFVDGTSYYTWSAQLNRWVYRGIDSVSGIKANELSIGGNFATITSNFGNVCIADIGNYRCVTFTGNKENSPSLTSSTQPYYPTTDLWCGLYDIALGSWIVPPSNYYQAVVGGATPALSCRTMCIAYNSNFYVISRGIDKSNNAILFGWKFNPASVAPLPYRTTNTLLSSSGGITFVGGLYTTSSTGATTTNLYLDVYTNDNALFVASGPNAWNGSCSVFSFIGAGATVGTLVISTTAYTYRHSIAATNGVGVLAAYSSSGGAGGNSVYATTFKPTTPYSIGNVYNFSSNFNDYLNSVSIGAAPYNGQLGGSFAVVASQNVSSTVSQNTYGFYTIVCNTYNTGHATTGYSYYISSAFQNMYLASKPVYAAQYTDWVMWVIGTGQVIPTLQPNLYLISIAQANILARGLYNLATPYSYFPAPGSIAQFCQPQTNWAIPAIVAGSLETVAVVTTAPKTIVPLAQGAVVSGARPTYYDGVITTECGFDSFPEMMTPTIIATTNGTLTANQLYAYKAIYRRFDNSGRAMYSSPGPAVVASIPSGTNWTQFATSATICWPFYTENPGFSAIRPFYATYDAIIYRTFKPDLLQYNEVGVFPDYGVATVVFDNIDDTTLSGNGKAPLYAPPTGELPNDPPTAFSLAVSSQQRIFTNSTEFPYRVYWSKPFSPSRTPEFNYLSSYQEIDPPSGPITGLAYMDNVLYIFKYNNIFALSGSGPDANGNGQFNAINKITSNSGCISSSSLITTDLGTFYQSVRGIELLSRGVTFEYVGAPIEGYLSGATVTAALNVAANSQVRFWLSTGKVLVYDYYLQKWSTFSSANGYYATSACIWNGVPVTLDTVNGQINVETTTFTDNGATVAMTIETPWIKFEHAQSWNRLRRVSILGDYKSTSTASLYFAYDWNNSYVDTINFDTGSGLTTIDTVYQWQARAPRQVMQAVRLKLVDTTITGESYDITNFALEYAVKGGIAKLPDRKAK